MTTGTICTLLAVWVLASFALGVLCGPRLMARMERRCMSPEDAKRLQERLKQVIDARECCTDLPEDFDLDWIEEHRGDAA